MGLACWLGDYARLLAAYGFVMYLWPLVVFRGHLKGRNRAYRFAFCATVSVMTADAVVLLLGFLHALNTPVLALFYWTTFGVRLIGRHKPRWLDDLRRVQAGTMSPRRLRLRWRTAAGRRIRAGLARARAATSGRRAEYGLLLALIAFATLYFGVGAFETRSFGFGDQYVHLAWIDGLRRGVVFRDGVYPLAMHCVIDVTCSLSGVSTYAGVLFFADIHLSALLVCAYLFMRAIFRGRFVPLIALTIFLTVDQLCVDGVYGMSRLGWTLPLEFALYAVWLCAWSMLRFLRSLERGARRPGLRALLADENLFIFTMATAVTVATHFYATIIAAFVCLAVAAVCARPLTAKGGVVPLALAALLAVAAAGAPMGAACAAGRPLEPSLYWALGVAQGVDPEAADAADGTAAERGAGFFGTLYRDGFNTLYPGARGALLAALTAAVFAVSLARRLIEGRKGKARGAPGGLIGPLALVALLTAYASAGFGLPALVAGSRLCAMIQLCASMVYGGAFDLLFDALGRRAAARTVRAASGLCCVAVYLAVRAAGLFHGYPYYELTRYPAAVGVTRRIVSALPRDTYTVVSTTDELYQLAETGYHEELLDLIEREGDGDYMLPTPYVFIYVEKRPLRYAQNHFAGGPAWLAAEKYAPMYGETASQYPDILAGSVSEEAAARPLYYGRKRSDSAADFEGRIILESKAWEWCRAFSAAYPNESRVVYEDDDFLCLCVTQNVNSLFSLGIIKDAANLHNYPGSPAGDDLQGKEAFDAEPGKK